MYSFHSSTVVRTPRLAFKPEELTEAHIRKLMHETWFLEAIFLASPSLHRMAVAWREGAVFEARKHTKLQASLTKYYSRMMSRATPFGLFAGCGIVASEPGINAQNFDFERHTRLDMQFSGALALYFTRYPAVRQHLTYFPNTSLYAIGHELRYVEYQYVEGRRVHQISAIDQNEAIEIVLREAQKGASFQELTEGLLSAEISKEEAPEFVEQLIESQLLVSNLEPAITGGDFEVQILKVLEEIATRSQAPVVLDWCHTLQKIRQSMAALDTQKINEVASYQTIIDTIKTFGVAFDDGKLFQVDMSYNPNSLCSQEQKVESLNEQPEIWEALEVLNRLSKQGDSELLQSFRSRFVARYEEQEISLLEALDVETGIGYIEGQNSGYTPLIEDLQVPQKEIEEKIFWDKVQDYFFEKFQTAISQNQYEIVIEKADLEGFRKADWATGAPSFAVMYRRVKDEQGHLRLLIESAGGASALPLLGRFAHTQADLLATIRTIATAEQAENPNVIFAEIIHIPENRTSNVLTHPPFRNYEIPFLGASSLPIEQQITLQDLYVSVQNGQVILRSKRLNKVVIPREAVLAFLSTNEGDSMEELRWQWGAQMIDTILRTFRYELPQKMALLYRLKNSFAKEFKIDTLLRQQLDKKYRTLKPKFQHLLHETTSDFQQKTVNDLNLDAAVFAILESDLPIDNLMSSLIHMLLNRLLPTQQRLHELVIYDFLYRYYKSRLAQLNQMACGI